MVTHCRLPQRRQDLQFSAPTKRGQLVVKDPLNGSYFSLGEHETFLLKQLDGRRHTDDVCEAFQREFGEHLDAAELDEFVEMARTQGLLQNPNKAVSSTVAPPTTNQPTAETNSRKPRNVLYWRTKLFDPNRLFDWLEPSIRFVWTQAFVLVSVAVIALAMTLTITNGSEIFGYYPNVLRWETVLIGWFVLVIVTTCHEFAHGLTCKHFGGEVHEIGFLLLFFMPSFYCNVSDAYLMNKRQRLLITLAGGFCDLIVWAIALLTWRVTDPGSLLHYASWVAFTICGVRCFLNLNPLLPLDGYYILGDLIDIENLRRSSREYLTARLRWLLWGADRPAREPQGRFLLGYGLVSWFFSAVFLTLFIVGLVASLGVRWGWLGVILAGLLTRYVVPLRFRGFFGSELAAMVRTRRPRTIAWACALGLLPALLCWVPMTDRASGSWRLRPRVRAEVRAPVSGFLKSVQCDEGGRIKVGEQLASLEIPDLVSRMAQKEAEVAEARTKLRILEIGPRPEEVAEQRQRVERAKSWHELAGVDLKRSREAHASELSRLDGQIRQYEAEKKFSGDALERYRQLLRSDAMSLDHFRETEKQYLVAKSQWEQTRDKKKSEEAVGTQVQESELAKRFKELEEARATLKLLEAGTRPEEVDGQRAHLARLIEEGKYLALLKSKVNLSSPVPGVVVTPRMHERIGHYYREGELICEVEEPTEMEVEVTLDEQELARVAIGQKVELKARALPFDTIYAIVERIAPAAQTAEPMTADKPATTKSDTHSMFTVYCRLDSTDAALRSGMKGHARIICGSRPVGAVLSQQLIRTLRTEFWW